MNFHKMVPVLLSLLNICIRTEGLLMQESSISNNTIHGSLGHTVDTNVQAEFENLKRETNHNKQIIQLLLNQIVDLENFKQQSENERTTIQQLFNQSAEFEILKNQSEQDRSTIQLLLNQSRELENIKHQFEKDRSTIQKLLKQSLEIETLKQQSEKDRSTIQHLLNQSVELDSLKQQSEKDRSTIQLLLNQSVELENLKQSSAKDRYYTKMLENVTQKLAENFDDLKVQTRYTLLSLLDLHSMAEELNGSLTQLIDERIKNINVYHANAPKRISFTASVSSRSSSWNSGTLVFPEVITNVGNAYNPSTGVFTAPIGGDYVFFVNVQSYDTNSVYVDIVLNGVSKVRTMAYSYNGYDRDEAGPNLVVLTLQKEDRVWVKHHFGQGYYSDGHITTFSGFLI